ncbi:hypothetical protein VP01_131g5 [Puccinia sorghi]|uniref:SANT domain-containing protein n=1 Tax=Puccinia sorghi TaxID=27349 RepID=A0A0L6VMX3_9BASI|nr:hypothetical protein VP01_131g5 [Puccinia sorghi]
MDRLRLRLSRKKRPTLSTPVTTTALDLSLGVPSIADSSGITQASTAGITSSLTAGGRTTRRTANFSTFGIGDAVTDAQFDFVLAQLGTADQKDPNIRAMKTTANIPDMALLPKDRLVSISDDENDTLVKDPIAFYQLTPPETELPPPSALDPPTWSAQEQEAFERSYAAQPKQFGWIASQVRTKNRAECVIHYYRTKRDNKYRNLHLPSQTILEGTKPRELRGKRSRRATCKTPTTDNNSLKSRTTKPTSDPPPTDNEPDDESTEFSTYQSESTPKIATAPDSSLNNHSCSNNPDELHQARLDADIRRMSFDNRSTQTHQANETASPITTTNRFHSSTQRDLPAPSPQSIIDPSDKTSSISRTELNELSTRSTESDTPIVMLTNQPLSHQSKSLDPHPAPSITVPPPKFDPHQSTHTISHPPSKTQPRAYKKRKVQPIDTSSTTAAVSSRPVPSIEPAHVAEPSKIPSPSAIRQGPRSYDTLNPVHPPNHRNPTSAQTIVPLGSRQTRGLELFVKQHICSSENSSAPKAASSSMQADKPAQSLSTQPKQPEPPVIRSSMQIKNLLNDDPVEPSVSMSNMDASAWFGNGPEDPTPEGKAREPEPDTKEKPLLKLPPVDRALLPPPGDHYHPTSHLPRPLSQPLSQPSFQPLPRPLSRPPSRPSSHPHLINSNLPPLPFHRHHQDPSESGAPPPPDYPTRHADGMMIDERFADPPSSPGSPSGGGFKMVKDPSSSHGHPEPHPSIHDKPMSGGRSSLSYQVKYERGFPGQDRAQEYYPSPGHHPHMTSHLQAHGPPSQSSPRPHPHYSTSQLPSQVSHGATSPRSTHSHLPSQFGYPAQPSSSSSSSSQQRHHPRASPSSTRASLSGPFAGQSPRFPRLPPIPTSTPSSNRVIPSSEPVHLAAVNPWPPSHHLPSHTHIPFPIEPPSSSSWSQHHPPSSSLHHLHHHHLIPPHSSYPSSSPSSSSSTSAKPHELHQPPHPYHSSSSTSHQHHQQQQQQHLLLPPPPPNHHQHRLPNHLTSARASSEHDLPSHATPRSASDSALWDN